MVQLLLSSLISFATLVAASWVDLDPKLLPAIEGSLPVLKLGSPTFLSMDLLNSIVGNVVPNVTFKDEGDGNITAYSGEVLAGFVNKDTGETRVYGDYASIPPATNGIDIEKALDFIKPDSVGFPVDDTTISIVKGPTLRGATLYVDRDNFTEEATYLTQSFVQRSIKANNGVLYPICGPGSQAAFGVGADNKVVSVSYLWKPAKISGQEIKPNSTKKAVDNIKAALLSWTTADAGVGVYGIDVCFYDSGVSFLQPVYRVLAQTHLAKDGSSTVNANRLLHYFPIGAGSPELLPSVFPSNSTSDGAPDEPQANITARSLPDELDIRSSPIQTRGIKPEIKVGRYVVRNDSEEAEFLYNARGFWSNLASSRVYAFQNSQYYWHYPFIYGGSANTFVNDVHLALTETHGAFHLMSTLSNCCDLVSVPGDLQSTGYGTAAGGRGGRFRLGFWIVNACEFMPTSIDFQLLESTQARRLARAFDPWRPVLAGGIHAIMSWRTSPFFADNTPQTVAKLIAEGRGVASSWLEAAVTDPVYRHSSMYIGQTSRVNQPHGRASSIYPCDRAASNVLQTVELGRPTCLQMRYYDNTVW
ncbi:hypothetical protein EST38_g404 [Candolleomyces aberdarensis]|uniref:Uncharacterized protein n=1 Tax=Candolleomyces aberdarensis TaxID=2316362 RepID=A0A4Q2E056_9AGAR|nr:hypothetical protein EST38_g404 [Candolleomyces aberdarensis]